MEPLVLFVFAFAGMLLLIRMIGARPLVVCRQLARTRWFWLSAACGVVAVLLTLGTDLATGSPLETTRLVAAGLLPPFLGWNLLIIVFVARAQAQP